MFDDNLEDRITVSLSLQQKWKDKDWIAKQISKGRLKPSYVEHLDEMAVILQELYPDNWDFRIEFHTYRKPNSRKNRYETLFYLTISPIVKIPDGIISSGGKKTLPMKSLYMHLAYFSRQDEVAHIEGRSSQTDTLHWDRIQGCRGVVSYDEYKSGYAHSHLQARYYANSNHMQLYNFCLGSGEAVQVMAQLSTAWNEDLFRGLLLMLPTVAYWESRAGVPYYPIASINRNNGDDINDLDMKEVDKMAHTIIDKRENNMQHALYFSREPIQFPLPWKVKPQGFVIEDNDKLEKFLRIYGEESIADYENTGEGWLLKHFAYKDTDGVYHPCRMSVSDIIIGDSFLPFRGKEVRLQVEGLLETPVTEFYIHPKIKNYVKQQLEWRANAQTLRSNAIEWLNRSENL